MRPLPGRIRRYLLDPDVLPVAALLLVALAARILWLASTRLTSEDAYITFRFARQLSQGLGFTYNAGEPIYGTTTPLLTLLLAAWRLVTGADIVVGAHALGLAASMSSLVLLDAVLRYERISTSARLVVLGLLALSSKVLILDLQGMEMPLVICLMMASWLTFSRGRPVWTGILAGCLLMARIDLALWPAALVLIEAYRSPRRAALLAASTALTYLPWLVFAYGYFGSVVPFTVTAKQLAHGLAGVPVLSALDTILGYLSPLDLPLAQRLPFLAAGAITLCLALWQSVRSRRTPTLLALSLFAILEVVALALTRATFQARYLYPLLWATLVLAALAVTSLWRTTSRPGRALAIAACALSVGALILQATLAGGRARATQDYRYEGSLEAIGRWLAGRGPTDASVLLEPLGYVGYYSGLYMIDEVGLVSPPVVALKLKGVPVELYFAALRPTYVVEHCDDAPRFEEAQADSGLRFADEYTRAATFDPISGDSFADIRARYPGIERSSCYVIWQRNQVQTD